MNRINSIDIVRGIVMMIMALDHTRDMMHIDSINQSPTDLSTTTPLLFFTRWITYLCAPIFVFLAGTSVYLSLKRKNNSSEVRKYLIKRGLWLLLLEFTIVNFAIFFDVGFNIVLFEVIGTIGLAFIILSALLNLTSNTIGFIGILIIFLHNLIPLLPFSDSSIVKTIILPLFNLEIIPIFAEKIVVVAYPPVPWLGIMLLGFAFGIFFELPTEKIKKIAVLFGTASLTLFICIRFINRYGDPIPWSFQKDEIFTFLSFVNVSKYPPSLLFCLLTFGMMFLLLAFANQFNNWFKKVTLVYGKVPLFYFVIHFYLVHLITILMLLFQGLDWSQFEFSTGTFGRTKNLETGVSLSGIYMIWLVVLILLYKPCLWFGRYKMNHNHWWLKYI